MSKSAIAAVLAVGLSFPVLEACTYNEALGRNQLVLVDDNARAQLWAAAWASALSSTRTS